jgi:hypothetical protein
MFYKKIGVWMLFITISGTTNPLISRYSTKEYYSFWRDNDIKCNKQGLMIGWEYKRLRTKF